MDDRTFPQLSDSGRIPVQAPQVDLDAAVVRGILVELDRKMRVIVQLAEAALNGDSADHADALRRIRDLARHAISLLEHAQGGPGVLRA